MDLKHFQEKQQIHPAQKLVKGDRVTCTIRHATDGSKNLINVEVIFLESNLSKRTCNIVYQDNIYEVPFHDMF